MANIDIATLSYSMGIYKAHRYCAAACLKCWRQCEADNIDCVFRGVAKCWSNNYLDALYNQMMEQYELAKEAKLKVMQLLPLKYL